MQSRSCHLLQYQCQRCWPSPDFHPPVALPKASTTCTGSTSNGSEQYSANMQHTVLSTTPAFVRSVAVHSMKISLVSKEIYHRQVR